MFGCLGTKKISEKNTSTKLVEKTETKSDSTSKETINKAIKDEAVLNIPESKTDDPEYDKRVNDAVANILKNLNFQKSSGDNSYKLYYDEKLRQLRAEFEVGQTKNSETSSNNQTNTDRSFEEKIETSVKKIIKMIPWWGWILLIWLTRHHILIPIIATFFPQVRGIRTVGDLFNPPNKNDT